MYLSIRAAVMQNSWPLALQLLCLCISCQQHPLEREDGVFHIYSPPLNAHLMHICRGNGVLARAQCSEAGVLCVGVGLDEGSPLHGISRGSVHQERVNTRQPPETVLGGHSSCVELSHAGFLWIELSFWVTCFQSTCLCLWRPALEK